MVGDSVLNTDVLPWVNLCLASCGLLIFSLRIFWPQLKLTRKPSVSHKSLGSDTSVSILIPARNEALNLPTLLDSIAALKKSVPFEVILIDDHSEDDTYKVAERYKEVFDLKLLKAKPLATGWAAKSWALYQAVESARYEHLLFIDADIALKPDSLNNALSFMHQHGADMISALPYHRSQNLWEKFMGPFHFLILLGTAPFQSPSVKRLFSIGQFLLFKRDAYLAVGGHASVKRSFAEDIELARLILKRGLSYKLFPQAEIFSVRMYQDIEAFFQGWKRLIRVGFKQSSALASLEVGLVIFSLVQVTVLASKPWQALPGIVILLQMLLQQKRLGEFSFLGVICWPFALGFFIFTSLFSLAESLTAKPVVWKGRAYKQQ